MFRAMLGWVVLGAMAGLSGCADNTPPPPNVPVPSRHNRDVLREEDPPKPLPASAQPQGRLDRGVARYFEELIA